jgi:hypothetical protein
MKSFAVLALLAIMCTSYVSAAIPLGTPVDVLQNTSKTVTYTILGFSPVSLTIEVDMDAQVTLSAYVDLFAHLPYGYHNLSFSTGVGYTLSIAPANAQIISATLTTSDISAAALLMLNNSVKAGCLEFDASTQTYSEIDVDWASSTQLSVDLPSAGTYIFVAVSTNSFFL